MKSECNLGFCFYDRSMGTSNGNHQYNFGFHTFQLEAILCMYFLMGYTKTSGHPHSLPPTPTHPKYTSIQSNPAIKNVPPTQITVPPTATPPNLSIKNIYPPLPTQNIPPPTSTHSLKNFHLPIKNIHPSKIFLHYSHPPPLTHKNVHSLPPTQNIPPPTPTHP